MGSAIAGVTLLVDDYDRAIGHYVGDLGFELLEDTPLSAEKRWVRVAPRGSPTWLLLARAANPGQAARIGDQTGGRVFLFLHTDDLDRDLAAFSARGIRFEEPPRTEAYGRVAVFRDGYGNRWDLIMPHRAER
ncbi:MAG: VOC family protein [Phycisphaerales bacterium]|nr:VOC family protein [Phycisphaerales bacterium]